MVYVYVFILSIYTEGVHAYRQWRTLTKIVGGAKRYYITVEGAN
jgi:hypothetical protein